MFKMTILYARLSTFLLGLLLVKSPEEFIYHLKRISINNIEILPLKVSNESKEYLENSEELKNMNVKTYRHTFGQDSHFEHFLRR